MVAMWTSRRYRRREVAEALATDRLADAVHENERGARFVGITGVPFFAIDDRYGVARLRCGPGSGQTIAFVGGTSAAAPLVAGTIALCDQQTQKSGLPSPGLVPALPSSPRPGIAPLSGTSFDRRSAVSV
jgi:hypothetical protein